MSACPFEVIHLEWSSNFNIKIQHVKGRVKGFKIVGIEQYITTFWRRLVHSDQMHEICSVHLLATIHNYVPVLLCFYSDHIGLDTLIWIYCMILNSTSIVTKFLCIIIIHRCLLSQVIFTRSCIFLYLKEMVGCLSTE